MVGFAKVAPLDGAAGPVEPVDAVENASDAAQAAKEASKEAIKKILVELGFRMSSDAGGAGGYGAVIAATSRASPAVVFAMKISQKRVQGDTSAHCDRDQILAEYRNLQLCTLLPHVVQLVFVPGFMPGLASRMLDAEREILGLLMEWVDGVSLDEAAEKQEWRAGGGLAIIKAMVAGVCGMHDLSLVHADIKPDNVRIHRSLQSATIVDLGMSRIVNVGMRRYTPLSSSVCSLALSFSLPPSLFSLVNTSPSLSSSLSHTL